MLPYLNSFLSDPRPQYIHNDFYVLDWLKHAWRYHDPAGDMSSHALTATKEVMVTQPMRDLYIFHYESKVENVELESEVSVAILLLRNVLHLFKTFIPSRRRGFPTVTNIGFMFHAYARPSGIVEG
jgi:hypothetical protein